MPQNPPLVTVSMSVHEAELLSAALSAAAELTAFLYRNPRPEDEAAYDDTDRALRAEYLALEAFSDQLEAKLAAAEIPTAE